MARTSLKEKEYRATDIKKYIRERMFVEQMTQRDLAHAIGCDPSTVCRKFKTMDFNVMELLMIFKVLNADKDRVGQLFILRKD